MGEKTGISWTDHTFNPWIGCTKVSAGCEHCYAERDNNRYGWVNGWGPAGERRKTSEANWKKPLAWNAAAERDGVRRKVFCASLADVFEDSPKLIEWRWQLWNLISDTPSLDWLLLTKRAHSAKTKMPSGWGDGWDNVWLGATVENGESWGRAVDLLLIPARKHFISVEPMLGPISHLPYSVPNLEKIDWVICGGESGSGARPMNLTWARGLRDTCKSAGVPFFFKQVGGTKRIDGHWGGDLLDGKEYKEFPA